jgi:peptide deformylase
MLVYELFQRFEDKVWTHHGLSISAPQIGLFKRLFIVANFNNWATKRLHKSFEVVINPEVIDSSSEFNEYWEGCLSVPSLECLIDRPNEIAVKYYNLEGKEVERELSGIYARV